MKHVATRESHNSQSPTASIVVIGYGNVYRHDDGAGLALAQKLVDYWATQGIVARLLTSMQLMPEMAADLADCDIEAVVFVDTVDTMAQNSVACIQILQVELDAASPSLGHHFDPATLLLYTALLYDRYPRAWLVTIPGVDFDHGEGFSNEVHQWLRDIPTVATQLLTEMSQR